MSNKLNLGVLFGGRSGEHEVSLMSARSVLSVINREKYQVIPIGITHNGQWLAGDNVYETLLNGKTEGLTRVTLLPEPGDNHLYRLRATPAGDVLEPLVKLDVVFPVLHGTFGEDGTLQGFLELADLAYVGAGVLGSSVGMDKGLFKHIMIANQIPILKYVVVTRRMIETEMEKVLGDAEAINTYPLFTKPANLGSSVGISKCRNRSDLIEGLLEAARYDRRVLIEEGLEKPIEVEVSVLGNDQPQASVVGEIRPSDEFYSYNAKYIDDRSELLIPARVPPAVTAEVQELALRAYSACDISGMARVDFLVDRQTMKVYLNELNTIPGFTKISMYPKLWEASGLSYPTLVDRLIELALERKNDRDRTERQFGRKR